MKIKFLSLILSIITLLLCSCGQPEGATVQGKYETINLNVYNWGEYISNEDDEECGLFDVNAGFEKYFNENLADKYGFYVKINYFTHLIFISAAVFILRSPIFIIIVLLRNVT
jgi:spermidine/putrescine-binding protein